MRAPVSNAIETVIARRVGEARDMRLVEVYRQRICEALGMSGKGYTQMLNNNSWPSVKELAVIAQVLEVPMEELLNY
ncbi:hypothetical protein AXW84_05940 [Hymenobacter sp. PAMC 26628]|nr:hypothetical protein AXW84_05940 [Hymenobacter sp. PAMC 26628]